MFKNYYITSFFWSTLVKVLNAVFAFISVPLLLGYFGKGNYGVLAIATACNGYMHLLDLGMNIGAVKYFSQWKAEKKYKLISKVAQTNITFYLIVAILNAAILVSLGLWGESVFSITPEQFEILRTCLYIIAGFSIFSWSSTTFNQLLIADKQIAYTQQIQCIQVFLKIILLVSVLLGKLNICTYFCYLTLIISILVVPYAIRCIRCNLIERIKLGFYWTEFREVITFSLSIFALSLFQTTATQSRPIILSMFAQDGVSAVADFRIIESFPALIIMIGGTFSSIFLPAASELIVKRDQSKIEEFAYNWTRNTTILANVLCIPFILSAKEILTAFVGLQYENLSIWLIIWCISTLIQVHTTPGNSLVLAYGKTRIIVIFTAISCFVSMLINIILAKYFGVGSAIIGYAVYVLLVIGLYYMAFYKKLLKLNNWRMFKSFLFPTLVSAVVFVCVRSIPLNLQFLDIFDIRMSSILKFIVNTILWFVPYIVSLKFLKLLDLNTLKI